MTDVENADSGTEDRHDGGIGCFEALCTEPADVLGMDEKFGVHVAFCEEHVENWNDVDHITLEGDR